MSDTIPRRKTHSIEVEFSFSEPITEAQAETIMKRIVKEGPSAWSGDLLRNGTSLSAGMTGKTR